MAKHLTASLEDYLEVIAELISKNGHAHTKEIAEKLHVKMPSVTGALRQLEQLGYILYNAHYPVELTGEGARVAEEVVRRHRILKKFFMDILGVSPEKATAAACHLEHVVDSDTIERFLLFSDALENRSDARELQLFLSEAMGLLAEKGTQPLLLSALRSGARGRVFRIGRNLQGQKLPFAEGDVLELSSILQEGTVFQIKTENAAAELSLRTAENIWIQVLE